jgi:sulfatase modifying factor 1
MRIQILVSSLKLGVCLSGLLLFIFLGACKPPEKIVINSLGMKLIRVPSGSFKMGESNPTPPHRFGQPKYLLQGDWDERPVYEVKISDTFYISETEITVDQLKPYYVRTANRAGIGSLRST